MEFKCIKCNFEPLIKENEYYYCKRCSEKFPIKFGIPIFLSFEKEYLINEIRGMQFEAGLSHIPVNDFLIREVEHLKTWEELIEENKEKNFNYYEMVKFNFDTILKSLELKENEKILEIGCGSSSYILSKFQSLGCEVWGVDICFRLERKKKKNINLVIADMNNLPFPSQSFDIAIASSCIHHTPFPLLTFKEINRILVKNGKFIMVNEPAWGIFKSFGKLREEDNRHFLINEHNFSVFKYYHSLRKAGFKSKFIFPPYIEKKLSEGKVDNFRFSKIGKIVSLIFKNKKIKNLLLKISPIPASIIFGLGISVISVKKD